MTDPKKPRQGYIENGVGYIPLTQRQTAIIDPEDVERLSRHNWYFSRDKRLGYARRSKDEMPMQKFIMDCPNNMIVDHINGSRLDNRKANLRICTQAENMMNRRNHVKSTSKYKGVAYIKKRGVWEAAIQSKDKRHWLGYYDNEEDAAITYNVAAQLFFGSYAYLNDV